MQPFLLKCKPRQNKTLTLQSNCFITSSIYRGTVWIDQLLIQNFCIKIINDCLPRDLPIKKYVVYIRRNKIWIKSPQNWIPSMGSLIWIKNALCLLRNFLDVGPVQFMHSIFHFIWVNQNRRNTIAVTGIQGKLSYVQYVILFAMWHAPHSEDLL
jgi:hypothetical protein